MTRTGIAAGLSLAGLLAWIGILRFASAQEMALPAAESNPLTQHSHTNQLIHETSPYLLQHAHNPVDWYAWGEEAFARARAEDRPIFLSIGYSACHWCHVMERECFENEAIAAVMNRNFVNIKVDREERPDVDEIYMKAVQALTGSGGWPLSAWLTPEGKPFYGGTYFPPTSKYGRPGFPDLCEQLARVYREDRERVEKTATQLSDHVRESLGVPSSEGERALEASLVSGAVRSLLQSFDSENGGFGQAPKFPHPMDLTLLLRRFQKTQDPRLLHVAEFSLRKMVSGGMYDQIGGGFHRYSVDERWLIPHFEKMLYDNALLARAYLDAFRVTGRAEHATVVREILEYVLREMTSPDGAFYASQDADSEGEEGKFFAWDPDDLKAVLGVEDAALAGRFYGVSEGGNFEHGKSVLWRPSSWTEAADAEGLSEDVLRARIEEIRRRLFDARELRVKPGRDEKVLADWNGMMISAMARAGLYLQEPRFTNAAAAALANCRQRLLVDGRLLRTFKDGKARIDANLGDFAQLVSANLDLYEATLEPAHLEWAASLTEETLTRFWDEEAGGFFFTADDHEKLLVRSKEAYDGATPSAVSVHVGNLLRLAELLARPEWTERAEQTLRLYHGVLERAPQMVSEMVFNLDRMLSRPLEIVLTAAQPEALVELLQVVRASSRDHVLLVVTDATRPALTALSGLVEGKQPVGGRATAYVCQDFACQAPRTDVESLREALADEAP